MDTAHSGPERRRFFRLKYPPSERPTLIMSTESYKINEISEGGIVFTLDNTEGMFIGDIIRAKIKFKDGQILDVVGNILRVRKKDIVLELVKGIPSKKVMSEQLFLKQITSAGKTFSANNKEQDIHEPRRAFKLRYPITDCPVLNIQFRYYKIAEITENEIKFIADRGGRFINGDQLKGKVTFRDGQSVEIEANISNTQKDIVSASFSRGIPFNRAVAEQLYLTRTYPRY